MSPVGGYTAGWAEIRIFKVGEEKSPETDFELILINRAALVLNITRTVHTIFTSLLFFFAGSADKNFSKSTLMRSGSIERPGRCQRNHVNCKLIVLVKGLRPLLY